MSESDSAGSAPRGKPQNSRLRILAWCVVLAALVIAWQGGLFTPKITRPPQNSIMVISPYRYLGTWVFDDPQAGLKREPFVAGIPEMIDRLVADIPDAEKGFRMLFSAQPFPGHQKKLAWIRADESKTGNWYRLEDPPMEGWLCPSLFK